MDQKIFMVLIICISNIFFNEIVAEKQPNIIFFLVDDMGLGDTSVPFFHQQGKLQRIPSNDLYRTPNMERLARQGRRFTNAYSYSVCSPTRISLMTGEDVLQHRVTTWTDPKLSTIDRGKFKTQKIMSPPDWAKEGLDLSKPLLPRLLKKAGYTTLFAGKAHFGPDDTKAGNPLNLGFDVNIAGYGGGGPGAYHGQHNYSAHWRQKDNHQWDVPGLEKYHGTDTFLTEAITLEMSQAISKAVEKQQPFFSYMAHYAVHAPFEVDDRFKKNYPQLKGHPLAFATLVEGMDKSLGDMLRHLNDLGVAEETLIIFTSDNGSAINENSPFKEKKGSRYEGGFRVPFIVAWAKPNPEHSMQKKLPIAMNSLDHRLITCVDMMPTLLQLAGAKLPEGKHVDGHDISPYFKGEQGICRPEEFVSHFPHKHRNKMYSTFRQKDWKIIYNYVEESWELYHLETDPTETNNLVRSQPERALSLGMEMIKKLESKNTPFPVDLKKGNPVKPNLKSLKP